MDHIDEAQQLVDDRLADALAFHRLRHAPVPMLAAFCSDCGKAIEPARRAVLPLARRCVACQTAAESENPRWR